MSAPLSKSSYAPCHSSSQCSIEWTSAAQVVELNLPNTLTDWLLDSESLTQRIKDHCQVNRLGHFNVKVLQQSHHILSSEAFCYEELNKLDLTTDSALIREVMLYCGNLPVVFARTVIPESTLTGSERQLANLGNKPLGEFLFAQAELQRDGMDFAYLLPGQALFQTAIAQLDHKPESLWARRSVFRLGDKPLLVTEVFLPELLSTTSPS